MDNLFNIPAGHLTLGQVNRLDDEAHSLARLLRDPCPGSDFDRIIDACNALRYALLAVDAHKAKP